jgi:hypothetical protein
MRVKNEADLTDQGVVVVVVVVVVAAAKIMVICIIQIESL